MQKALEKEGTITKDDIIQNLEKHIWDPLMKL
jgi:hypothetical protein